jgi:predicted small metal-binding protein
VNVTQEGVAGTPVELRISRMINVALKYTRHAGWGNRPGRVQQRIIMRKYIDCREFPSDMKCSVTIAADSDQELLEVAVQHACAVHGHKDNPELRAQIRTAFHEGAPAA